LPSNWSLKLQSTNSFADEYLKLSAPEKSYMAKAMKAYADGATEQAEAEKARILPKVGVYGESYAYRGERSVATSFNAGFYIQMNLYSPGDLDSIELAKINSKAMQELSKNLELIQENAKLMEEQLTVSQQLFSSGAINAIQLSEVFSRRADIIQAKANIESEYLKARAGLLTLSETNLEGIKNE
jgi:outer membrane protein TolC